MKNLTVISLGGSIIAPNGVDIEFLKNFYSKISEFLQENKERKIIIVCGGGAPARVYQDAYYKIAENIKDSEADWIGVKATHLNGRLVRAIFDSWCSEDLIIDPTENIEFKNQVLVAAGWKPGFSSDTDAVYLAQKFNGKLIVNLSNIDKVYSADPKTNPDAVPVDHFSWKDFIDMVGTKWTPGANTPFDPIASQIARDNKMKVICSDGRNIQNTLNILNGQAFEGTLIE